MELTREDALRAYARMLNTLDIEHFAPLVADDFVYESQSMLTPLVSREAFMDYMVRKLQTIEREKTTVFAEMGMVTAYGNYQPCVILAQFEKSNLEALALAEVAGDRVRRIDLCIVPPPRTAERSGEYPV